VLRKRQPLGRKSLEGEFIVEESVTFKPILWRLAIWKSLPLYLGWAGGILLDWLIGHSVSSFWRGAAIGVLVAVVIVAFMMYYTKLLDINISEGQISGPSSGYATRTTFPLTHLDRPSVDKQSLFQKIFIGQVLQSVDGEKIIFAPFIYQPSAEKIIQRLLSEGSRSPSSAVL
jgi:hypothetical protein